MSGKKAPKGSGSAEFLPSSWCHGWLFGLILVAVTLVAYQPVWHAGFIWDDDILLTDNPIIKSADGLYKLWFTASTPDYFPMTSSMLWLEWRIWGNNPLGYHLVNVILHALSAVVLWRVLLRLKIPGALLAAAIFALHPVNVESVAWIAERKNTLAMVFYLGALLAWVKFEDSGRSRWYGLALAAFALALLSKTAVAPLPLVLLGLAWWRRGRVGWKDVWRVVPFFVMAAVLALVTVWFQYHRAIGHDVVRTDGFWPRLAGAGWAVWFYFYKAALPLNLCSVYPHWQIDARNMLSYIPLLLFVAAFVFFWCYRRRWGKGLFFGLGYFVVMLLPILGFLNIYFMRYSLVADRWQYFAIIGPITLAAAIIRRPIVAVALLFTLGVLTWKQCGMYANAETFWQMTLHQNPNSWLARDALGNLLLKQGRVDEAISQYQLALQTSSDYAQAHSDLGIALLQREKVDDAITQFQKALEIEPIFAEAHLNLSIALLQKGSVDEAIVHCQKALEINADDADAHYNLGVALWQKGSVDEAITHFQKALQIRPGNAKAENNLGNAFLKKGAADEAIAHFQKAWEFVPNDPEFQNNLAWVLATCPKASLRNGSKALELARQANTLTGGENPIILHTLAAALAEAGRFDDAVESGHKAMELARAAGRQDLAEELNRELQRYEAGLPLHQ